jgi:long-chain fatty acid transport protein
MEFVMKLNCIFVVLLSLFFGLSWAWGGGFALPSVGSKAASMGGAFRGLANDWSAAYWNPAGLAFQDSSEVSFSLSTLSPKPEYTPNIKIGEGDFLYELGYKNGEKRFPDDKTSVLSNFAVFYKVPEKNLNFGVAVFVPYALHTSWNIFAPPLGYNNTAAFPEQAHQSEILVYDFHPTLSAQIIKGKLSAGVGASIQKGDLLWKRTLLLPNSFTFPRPYDHFLVDYRADLSGWGFGFNLGVLYNLTSQVQIGASFRSPVDLDLSGKTDFDVYWPSSPGIIAQDSSMAPYFSGGMKHSEFSTDMKLHLPANYGVGIVYKLNEKTLFTLDVDQTRWTSFWPEGKKWASLYELKFVHPTATYMGKAFPSLIVPQRWKNTIKLSLGGEYIATDKLVLRGGIYRDPSPIPDSTFSPLLPDAGDKSGLNFGISYQMGRFQFNYSYEFLMSSNRTVDKLNDVNQDGIYDNFPGAYALRTHTSYLSISYRF